MINKIKKRSLLRHYSVFDIVIIAMCASLGVAIKSILIPLVHIITGPLFISGGAVAGGFYMLFIVLAAGLVKKPFSATLACAVQAIMVIITGVIGSHGIMMSFAGIIANTTGSFLTNIVFFRLPYIPLMVTQLAAAVSGGFGGAVAYYLITGLKKTNPTLQSSEQQEKRENLEKSKNRY